ncbi:class F sortase [Nesterenkonia sandarakina]|uniref:Sortase family protein n=1 Tax=Nesterenkonia sandarakina TaxID=272918 RepID=A0A2T0YEV5_9MICC|nr:class F sortase [Nesterenkonia sandarakina]PRZ13427.1 sortase family protein [Nesterenkonia sandarakina]
MLPPRRPQHEAISTAPASPRRGGALALGCALMLALSACSPGQDAAPAAGEEAAPAAVESEAGRPETTEPAEPSEPTETDADPDGQDAGEDDATPTPTSAPTETEAAPEAAPPASFEIPAIGAGSDLLHLGLRENNTLEVPPGDPGSPASWYTGSPAPGEPGPAVLLGHVDDSLGQPGVFADLPALAEGDEITVDQEDGETATFVVTKAEQYGKNTFPTLEVYGNTEDPELRLITCDGYNEATGEYEDNYVVYATLAD